MHQANKFQINKEKIGQLDFLWLELTNQCNLQCVHCYAESGPRAANKSDLAFEDYTRILDEAYDLGCRSVQFIGGEPTLNSGLSELILHARNRGYSFIEVFTNLIKLPEAMIALFEKYGVHVATSVYADTAAIHDNITTVNGSFSRTISNVKKLVAIGVPIRVAVIAMDQNAHRVKETIAFVRGIGVPAVSSDRLRRVGRGAERKECEMAELCGQCAEGKLCVGPDGVVSPCIMSKAWSVGSVRDNALADIAMSESLRTTRNKISTATTETTVTMCNPNRPFPCSPDQGGPGPCNPNQHCGPNSCLPVR